MACAGAGWDFKLTTSLGFDSMLTFGVLTITGYVILDYLRLFKQSEHNMAARGVTPADIESVSGFSNLALFLAISGALIATALVGFLARGLESLALDYLRQLPWNVVLIGLFCLLLIAFYLYWLFARRRDKAPPPDESGPA